MKKIILIAATLISLGGTVFAYNHFSKAGCCCGTACTCADCTCTEGNCTCNASCCDAPCCKEEASCCKK